ncbi:ubiquinone/menaquinone biosynthesis methyltransferase [Candidatus Karelsulcia muelleri]|uniref:Demethylmenaquinone methyltransferase n=1 Tax=Candidatus Karelsulcia muelleri TaxID=336810 RepID=A0A3A1MM64_9FLAO|nr:ubiquinone/menaquinone biosynthesis methyltransferase [Candidatus Karelsulcia muelleri]RIU85665.1 ubiquinone/menaquinone biosynthesis methyltransferase [Candidatus Karelsulcia muelleri]RIU86041.1 ubiquinone/menaquinone biosynthesis methyltransferase [Candidatus Karelsulcia muelleri]
MIYIKPLKNSSTSKTDQIEKMFDIISSKYDLINQFISLGYDIKWRKKFSDIIVNYNPKNVLDLATGTGIIPIIIANKKKISILGLDISKSMINICYNKIKNKIIYRNLKFIKADCQKIFFLKKNQFDIVTIVFGIRNIENINNLLKEVYRVLKYNGILMILEFSNPNKDIKFFNKIYKFYSKYILLNIVKVFTKNLYAYKYLLKSIDFFTKNVSIKNILKKFKFKNFKLLKLNNGIVSIYIANK